MKTIMVDLHLLSKISNEDYSFLKMISLKICNYNSSFVGELRGSVDQLNWNHTYFLLLEFYKKSAPYSTRSFMSTLTNTMDKVKISDNQRVRSEACQGVIEKIEDGTDNLRNRFLSPTPAL